MKIKLISLLLFIFIQSFAQNKLPIIHSNSESVKIIENKVMITNWNLVASTIPDIYITGKFIKSQHLKIITDIDSLEINLKPNENFDFIVLKNQKDTCFTRFQSYKTQSFSKTKPSKTEKIPFKLTPFNNIQVQAVLNKKDSVNIHFDTGASDFYLTKDAIKKYFIPKNGPLTMNDISDNTFTVGNLKWEHQQIYPNDLTAQGNEGLFGWNVFDGKILEVNYDSNEMTVYTKLPKISKDYEKFDIEFMREQFRINIAFEIDGKKYNDQFLFDTGFQKAVMLDHGSLLQKNISTESLQTLNTSILRNSRNEEIPLKTVNIDKLIFGKYSINNIPSELNNYNKPTGYGTHFIGSDIIKRFNLIFDFQKNVVYLKPNNNFKDKYFEAKHKL